MANWEEILKKPLVSIPKQRIRIKKPKKIEQEDDCKRKLVEIAKRMSLLPLFDMEFKLNGSEWTSQRVRTEEVPDADSYSIDDGRHGGKLKVGTWLPEDLRENATHGAIGYLRGAGSDADINELPEKVCCEALKHLKAVSNGNVLSEQTISGWTIGSRVKLETYGKNPSVHLWNREVNIKNAQGPTPQLSIGISLKFFIPTPLTGHDGKRIANIPVAVHVEIETNNLVEVTRVFRECDKMFKEAVA